MKLKYVINSSLIKITHFLLLLRYEIQKKIGVLKNYQPDPFDTRNNSLSLRSCYDRLDKINEVLSDERKNFSYMDIGCHTGFFLFKLVDKYEGFGLGIDHGVTEVMVANSAAKKHKVNNISFINYELNDQNIISLPQVDVIIFLSVFHHFVRYFHEKKALAMLESISNKCNKFFIFETGQPNEKSKWAHELNFMGENYDEWIINKLKEFGFDEVNNCGQFETSVSSKKRTLFIAKKLSD
tara:strand:+ start:2529 stop:3245 length:717 start_codon:yes stop_codon:yes gene_type:complete